MTRLQRFSAIALGALLGLGAAGVQAKGKTRGTRLKPAPTVTYADGQTAQQREKSEATRLKRECKGRPNAGACLGYTR